MKYLALILFCLWVLSRALGAQEPAASFAERFVGAAVACTRQSISLHQGRLLEFFAKMPEKMARKNWTGELRRKAIS
jgi:hypothetical protein